MKRLTRWMRTAFVLGASMALAMTAQAQDPAANWPGKPVRIIVNFAPGGSADNSMRPFAERLSRVFGQQFVIENRGGASGALGMEAVARSAPDGYTYLVTPALTAPSCRICASCRWMC